MGASPEKLQAPGGGAARVQPDARLPRLPPRHRLSRDRRDAGPRHLRGGGRGRARDGRAGDAGDHGAAGHDAGRARPRQGAHRRRGGGRRRRDGRHGRVPGRHHDRAAPRGACARRRSPRRRSSSPSAPTTSPRRRSASRATTPPPSSGPTRRRASSPPTPSSPSTRRGWASSCASPRSAGARSRNALKLGICGEHGGDPASIRFCQGVGLDYVSCSPYRVPIARLAAAQAALNGAVASRRMSATRTDAIYGLWMLPVGRVHRPRRRERPEPGAGRRAADRLAARRRPPVRPRRDAARRRRPGALTLDGGAGGGLRRSGARLPRRDRADALMRR